MNNEEESRMTPDTIAYFSMEIALEPGMPTYSMGMLAGDTIRSAADQFTRIMRQAIALNASHFNTQRMVQEYVLKAYFQ